MGWSRNAAIGILVSLLASDAMATNTWMVWKEYQIWAKAVYPENDVALAVAPNGKSAWGAGSTVSQAKHSALGNCKAKHIKVQWENCRVVDINFSSKGNLFAQNSNSATNGSEVWCAKASRFFKATKTTCNARGGQWKWTYNAAKWEHLRLKNKAEKSAKTTSEVSKRVWCATDVSVTKMIESSCTFWNGQGFSTQAQAQAEHLRLKNQSSPLATTTSNSSKKVWCATRNRFWAAKKRSACGSAKVFTSRYQAEMEHLRLKNQAGKSAKTTSEASKTVWCATNISVFETTESACSINKGKSYPTYSGAQAEHLRLKNKAEKSAKTTSEVSKRVWCATKYSAFETTEKFCTRGQLDAQIFPTEAQAQAEHLRLKNQAGKSAKTTSEASKTVWCAAGSRIFKATRTYCNSQSGGKSFSTKPQAIAAAQRAKSENNTFRGVIFALAVVIGIIFLKRIGGRTSRSPNRKPSNWESVPRTKHRPPTPPETRRTPVAPKNLEKDPREQSLGIEASWPIERKRNHVRQEFNKWNGRIVGLPPGEKRNEAQEKLRICGELTAKYGV